MDWALACVCVVNCLSAQDSLLSFGVEFWGFGASSSGLSVFECRAQH